MIHSVLFSLVSLWSFTAVGSSADSAVKGPFDVCERDTFEASCPPGDVILMTSAIYGRMDLGSCIRQHVSNRNCDVDVLHIVDGFCSGLNSCTVRPIDPKLFYVKPCPDYAAYLKLSYRCLKGLGSRQSCSSAHNASSPPGGFLTSSQRLHHGLGTKYCPWTINANQRLNFTLMKFVPFKESPLSSTSSVCFEIGTIQEGRLSQGILTCGSDPRNKSVFVSSNGPVRVHFKENEFLKDLGNFVLHFKAVGCSDPPVPDYATYNRKGNDIILSCDHSDVAWSLQCQNGKWTGERKTCPAAGNEDSSVFKWIKTNTKYSLGLLALVTVGCAVVIFILGFCVYVTYFYAMGFNKQPRQPSNYEVDIYKLQTMQRLKASRPPSIAVYERTTSLHTPPGTMRRNTDYQRMNPIDPDTVSHHSYVLYDHVPKPLPPIPIQDIAHEKKHIYETPLRPTDNGH